MLRGDVAKTKSPYGCQVRGYKGGVTWACLKGCEVSSSEQHKTGGTLGI